jgi:pimeloyl-ACP methyl ester carboxylesterase
VPSLELALAAVDLMRTGFDVEVAVDVSLRLHYTDSFMAEMVMDEESGDKVLRREEYAARYRHGIQRDARRDTDGSVFWGHLAAVRGHNLTREEAEALRNAPFERIVVYGRDDRVVTPCASRDLARRIGARAEEVPGAHFIIDEASREVNSLLASLWKSSVPSRSDFNPFMESYIIRSLARWTVSPA